jgi:hypothetical protein
VNRRSSRLIMAVALIGILVVVAVFTLLGQH